MAKDILKYPGWMYAYGISSGQLSMDDARVEYMRLYHALKERQRRIRKSEFAGTKFARTPLVPLSKIKSESQFHEELQSMASKARGRQTSLSGLKEYRKDVAAALDVYGAEGKSFSSLTSSQWTEFGAYMKRIHQARFDSERAVRMFRLAKGANMTAASLINDYDYWTRHEQDLLDYMNAGNPLGGRVSSQRLREYLDDPKTAIKSAKKANKKKVKTGANTIRKIRKEREKG